MNQAHSNRLFMNTAVRRIAHAVLLLLILTAFFPVQDAVARDPEPTPTAGPTPTVPPTPTPGKCIANWCGPVCEFPGGVDYLAKPTTPDWLQVHYDQTILTDYPFSTPPHDTMYICMDSYIGSFPLPNPNELLALRYVFLKLEDTARNACENQQYCNKAGDYSKCKLTYEMVDPDRPTPPEIRHDDSRGEYYMHGCVRFTCKPGKVPPKGCEDDDPSTCDICHEDGSCGHPPAPGCVENPTPVPSPGGGGRSGGY